MFWDSSKSVCSVPWYRTYCKIFRRLRSKRTHCFFLLLDDSWLSESANQKKIGLLLLLLPKRLFWNCDWIHLSQLGLLVWYIVVILVVWYPFLVYHSQNTLHHQKENTIMTGLYWLFIRPLEILSCKKNILDLSISFHFTIISHFVFVYLIKSINFCLWL